MKKNIFLFVAHKSMFFLIAFLLFGACFLCDVQAERVVHVDVTGSSSLSYDDNVTLVQDESKSDWFTDLMVRMGIRTEGKKSFFQILGDVTQELFFRHTEFNNIAQNIQANFKRTLSKFSDLEIFYIFSHSEEPSSFEDAFGRTSGRYSYYKNTWKLNYSRALTKHLALQTRYANEDYDVSRDDLKDSIRNSFDLELNYFHTSALGFILAYNLALEEFDPGEDASVQSFLVGFRRYFSKQMYLDGKVGTSFLNDYRDNEMTEPYFSFSLVDEIDDKTVLNVTYVNQNSTSLFREDIFDSWRLSGLYHRQLMERLGLGLSVFFGEGTYVLSNVRDENVGLSMRFDYTLKKDKRAFFSYTYSNTDSTDIVRDYSRNMLSFGFSWDF